MICNLINFQEAFNFETSVQCHWCLITVNIFINYNAFLWLIKALSWWQSTGVRHFVKKVNLRIFFHAWHARTLQSSLHYFSKLLFLLFNTTWQNMIWLSIIRLPVKYTHCINRKLILDFVFTHVKLSGKWLAPILSI